MSGRPIQRSLVGSYKESLLTGRLSCGTANQVFIFDSDTLMILNIIEEPFPEKWKPAVHEVKETKDSVIYRVDLPHGLARRQQRPFLRREPVMSEYDHDGRKYGGTMVFNPVAYNVKEATAKLRDGVLWITVRGIPGVNIKLTVVEKMLNCRITRDDVVY
ncbi:hypothetical protein Bca52824_064263 [Brassica carinata]|uniref:SHSP domain-containing protein n=1 Tax=Brassica carinata TaxID=52824 RepID=A0A8X7QH54_BRACI|nr:hypothetical protein Bca52824_064263 [Brassica carinata]